jgi:nucleotide-binding universal stress UspA family protein
MEAVMRDNDRPRVLVGVDQPGAALGALRWAAAEARLRGAVLDVVRAWDPVPYQACYAVLRDRPNPEQERLRASAELAAGVRAAFGADRPQGMMTELAEGVPERVLVQRSAGAELLVLGATIPEFHAGQPTGPVIRACIASARCPVVIISTTARAAKDSNARVLVH